MKEELSYPNTGSCQRNHSPNQSAGATFAVYTTMAFEVRHEFQTDDVEMTNQGDRMVVISPLPMYFKGPQAHILSMFSNTKSTHQLDHGNAFTSYMYCTEASHPVTVTSLKVSNSCITHSSLARQ